MHTSHQSPDHRRTRALSRRKARVCKAAGTLNTTVINNDGGRVCCVAALLAVRRAVAHLPAPAGRPVQSALKRRRRRVAASCRHASQHEGGGLRAALRAVQRASAHLPAIA